MSTPVGADSGTCSSLDGIDPTTACLSFPIGVAVDMYKNIYISEVGCLVTFFDAYQLLPLPCYRLGRTLFITWT
jgi:hypothetical protein